jgi:hypothetical protein
MSEKSVINFARVTYQYGGEVLIEGYDQRDVSSNDGLKFSKSFTNPLSALISLSMIQEYNMKIGLPLLIVEFVDFPDIFPEQKALTDF